MLSPNDVRAEENWPPVPGGDNIVPPISGGLPAGASADDPPQTPTPPPPSDDEADKVARLDQHRGRHA